MRRPRDRQALAELIGAHPVEGTIAEERAAFAARLASRAPDDARWIHPGGVRTLVVGYGEPVAVWLHGGGYLLGSPETHAFAADWLARLTGRAVAVPAYALAPENPWPAQLRDALSAVDALRPLAVVGDSSGGHLALHVALRRPGRLRALALFSPNTDRTGLSDTREANTPTDLMNSDEGDRLMFTRSMHGVSEGSVAASPLLADLTALPPIYLAAGGAEVLLGDSRLLADRLAGCGVPHIFREFAGQWHMFQNWPDTLPAGANAMADAADHILRHTS